jgi:predicted metal-dependent phosphoesterase TrpH
MMMPPGGKGVESGLNLIWDWAGARWWKFDFHAHTPGSSDFGKGKDQRIKQQIEPEDWLLSYMRAGIDCVAITDHNSGSWIDPLKKELIRLEKENHPDFRPLYVFPGVEISTFGNLHLLAIFPYEKTTSDISRVLGAVGYKGDFGKCDSCTEESIKKVIDAIASNGGLAIPAHVDQPCGLFRESRGTSLEQVINHKDIFAIEVTNRKTTKPQLYIDRKKNWSEIIGSDLHDISGDKGQCLPGDRYTWVKMSKPSFDGLKLALMDGESSLKRHDECSNDPNHHCSSVIERVSISRAKYIGVHDTFECQFNPWLNTIIGGRGTGKSSIIEFVRIALMREGNLPNSVKTDLAKYRAISSEKNEDGLLTSHSEIIVYYRKDGGRLRITWSTSKEISFIEEEVEGGNWVPSEGDIPQRFPVRMYSQKQIFEMAKDSQALLHVVDDAQEVEYREWKQEWDTIVSKYLSLQAQYRAIDATLNEENVILGQLADVRRKLEVFERAGHTEVLKTYRYRQNQKKAIEAWEKSFEETSKQLKKYATLLPAPHIEKKYFSLEAPEETELFGEISEVMSNYGVIIDEIGTIAGKIEAERNKWLEKRKTLKITVEIETAVSDYQLLCGQLTEANAGDPAGYGLLVNQRHELDEKLGVITGKKAEMKRLKEEAQGCLDKLHEHRQIITRSRKVFLHSVLSENPYVKIEVFPYGNKEAVEKEIRELIDRSTGGYDRIIGTVDGKDGLLSSLYQDSTLHLEEKIEALKQKITTIYYGDEKDVESISKDKRFVNHIKNLVPERIDRLQCWFPGDALSVKYCLKPGDKFKPIEQGSPGQKTAALLAFILSYGEEPLILDQPEDDLDNNLIYDLIVAQLKDIKGSRQIIIVTHNANIVVNGDSENVTVLDTSSSQTFIVTTGSLQDSTIRKEICKVMEGGEEAFEQRYRRIKAGKWAGS